MVRKTGNEDGYSLTAALFVLVVVTTVFTGLLSTVLFYNNLATREARKYQLALACYSVVQQQLTHAVLPPRQTIYLQDSTRVDTYTGNFGLYPVIRARAIKGNDTVAKGYMIGSATDSAFSYALTFSDPNFRGSVVGETRITGDICAVTDKITASQIYGIAPSSGRYLNGTIRVKKNIPEKLYDETKVANLFELLSSRDQSHVFKGDCGITPENKADLLVWDTLFVTGSLTFSGDIDISKCSTLNIFASGSIMFSAASRVTGNYCTLFSDTSIVVEENCRINNIACVSAATIDISPNSELACFQGISKSGISVKNASLLFPSLLMVYYDNGNKSYQDRNPELTINGSSVNGELALLCSYTNISNNRSRIFIDKESTVHGVVYSENHLTPEGAINGSVYTNALWFVKEPTIYKNWLVNTRVNRTLLDKNMLTTPYYSGQTNYYVVGGMKP
ncbi:MAG: hypothetical protein HYV28_08315 [Ignavibacteriales bacterium]|nr:hypothetical protein [Ignavibacteriales bacterium]